MDRRKRQFGLFLVTVVLSGQRLQAVKQAQRELFANLEKISLLEIIAGIHVRNRPQAIRRTRRSFWQPRWKIEIGDRELFREAK